MSQTNVNSFQIKTALRICDTKEFPGVPSRTDISLKGGFDPNCISELIYTGKNPLVMGLGFAAIRDMASFLDIN